MLVLEQGQGEQKVGEFWEKKRLILDGKMGAILGKCRTDLRAICGGKGLRKLQTAASKIGLYSYGIQFT